MALCVGLSFDTPQQDTSGNRNNVNKCVGRMHFVVNTLCSVNLVIRTECESVDGIHTMTVNIMTSYSVAILVESLLTIYNVFHIIFVHCVTVIIVIIMDCYVIS